MSYETRTLVEASQTLGAAFLAGLRPHVRCLRGKRMGPVKVEPCGYTSCAYLRRHFERVFCSQHHRPY